MSLVSVVIPAYNAEKTIEDCVNSILNQTYNNFELIIVNDGSTDNTLELCEKIAQLDNRITIINKDNQGVSAARNDGIDKASGKYLLFVDSDDTVDKEYIKTLVEAKENNPEFDNVWCKIKSTQFDFKHTQDENFLRTDFMTLYNKKECCSGSPINKIYELDCIKEFEIKMPLDISLGEDLIFNLEYLNHNNGKILIIDKPLYFYFENNNQSLSKKYRNDLFTTNNTVNNAIKEKLQLWEAPQEEFEQLNRKIFMNYQDAMFNEMVEKNHKPLKKKIKFNNEILNNPEFQGLLDKYGDTINPIMAKLYKLKNYWLIYWLLKIKH